MLPYFFHPGLDEQARAAVLDEPTSKHCIQVLRMQEGDGLLLTDGKGLQATGVISVADRKRCKVSLSGLQRQPEAAPAFSLGVAFTKNNSRNEWLLEKATETGIAHIYPLICARSEKEKFNAERLHGILVSAMLQSQRCYLPELHEPLPLKKIVQLPAAGQQYIAHCLDNGERSVYARALVPGADALVLVGPEGDFTPDEITLCLEKGFRPVTFGASRLRTETAGLYACTVFNALNDA